jgi:hypothetical protein
MHDLGNVDKVLGAVMCSGFAYYELLHLHADTVIVDSTVDS